MVANGKNIKPVFIWWVSKRLKKRSRTLAKVKAIFQKPQKYKFCFQVLSNVSEPKKLDDENVKTLWQDSIKKNIGTSQVDKVMSHSFMIQKRSVKQAGTSS